MAGGPARLRVMSFNVRGFTSPVDGRHRWPRRAALNVATVRDQAPDLLGVQELQTEALATYRAQLPDHGLVLGPAAGTARRPEYDAIFFVPDRLEVVEAGGSWLSETPDVPSSSWGSRNVRAVNWATFAVRGTDVTLRHVNTHLDHWSGRARARSTDVIVRGVGDGSLPTILTGDFNCPPGPGPHATFLAHGYEDTCRGRDRDEATFHGFGGVRSSAVRLFHRVRYGRRPLRLDWILVADERRRWRVEDSATVRDRDPLTGAPPSDHDPVIADLCLVPDDPGSEGSRR